MELRAEHFAEFFEAIWGYAPFPWQVRLCERVLRQGWPAQLDLPTGVGKTTALDIALFALAVDPQRSPRRVVLVVDRRLVVSQGARHAEKLVKQLDELNQPVVVELRRRLRGLFGDTQGTSTVATAELRGGMPRETDWARRPDQALLAVSTVDQVGSRLLFRGYGVSERMASVHAGLFGNDALILLDEVHLSTAFAETLGISERWRTAEHATLPARWRVVRMSATPGQPGEDDFRLEEADHADPRLHPRLFGHKPTRIVSVEKLPKETLRANAAFAERAAQEALALVQAGARRVGVVVNRVDSARAVWAALDGAPVDRALLTGRMRALDREAALRELLPRLQAGPGRIEGERPLVVAATQCIEAGADLDFDALVTECASLDALRQRFGRLDRRGEQGHAPGVVLVRCDARDDDPVYGGALNRTAKFLRERTELDFGTAHLCLPEGDALAALLAPKVRAPVLLPSTLGLWAQTHPRPWPDPEVSLWLHGDREEQAQVSLVWRADLSEEELVRWKQASDRESEAIQAALDGAMELCPPCSIESLTIPLHAARAWLSRTEALSFSDVEGEDAGESARGERPRPALRWRGDGCELVMPGQLRPGDTLVVPASYGGLQAESWDPGCAEPVRDLGELANWRLRGRALVRLDSRTLPPGCPDWPSPPRDSEEMETFSEAMDAWLAALGTEVAQALAQGGWRWLDAGGAPALLTRGRAAQEASTEDDNASFPGEAVTLERHCGDVERWARGFAERLGLPPALREDLALAGWFHDIGKADPRFQAMLLGGSALARALQPAPLAKSPQRSGDRAARERARQRAGYPAGLRHELMSLAMLDEAALARAHDPELVKHLVASHHGYCRPFAPALDDTPGELTLQHGADRLRGRLNHQLGRLGSGVAERFVNLNQRYGWWGLAWLEAILRLADHRASEEEASAPKESR